jgi:hypothetical protein
MRTTINIDDQLLLEAKKRALESGSEWVTTDKGFKKFKGLKLHNPLQ